MESGIFQFGRGLVGQEREPRVPRVSFCSTARVRNNAGEDFVTTLEKGDLRMILMRDNANLIRGIASGKFFVRGDIIFPRCTG